MKIYISHAEKDTPLARNLATSLRREGIATAGVIADLFPGENWSRILGHDLETADWCVFLFTPGSREASPRLRADFTFVVGKLRYQDRVISILASDSECGLEEVPWTLRNLPTFRAVHTTEAGPIAEEILTIVLGALVHA